MSPAKRVLLVEDQRLIAADLENTIKKLGYELAGSVASGEEAIAKATEVRPDLILMDIRLRGELDGIQAAEVIRERTDVPIVYLTAYADEETIMRAKGTHPFGYVVKPFNERELRATIEVALYKHDTELVLAEERARRRAAEEFKLLVGGVKDYAIFMLDAGGRVATWNEGARRITGYAAEEILGQHCSVFYPADETARGIPTAIFEQALRQDRVEIECWRLKKDGSRFWASVVASVVRNDKGELHGFGEVTRDLTERKRAEEQREHLILELKGAVRSRDEFLQIAAHELKTPLTPLQLQLESLLPALAKAGVMDERFSEKVKTAMRQAERLLRLVESLLEVSRIVAGAVVLEIESFDLVECVGRVAQRFDREARQAGSPITVHGDDSIPGRWDRSRLEQIISHLISNAIKYGKGRPIEIDARANGGMVRLSVTDHGMGIDMQAIERIFGRFERAVSHHHFGGFGLGLFVARQLTEAHGGRIVVQSEPGAGSTFTVLLPVEATARPAAGKDGQESAR